MKPLIYVAGPYTNPDPVLNVREAIQAADELWTSGQVVPLVPHLTMFWHLVSPKGINSWYRYDLELLDHCDGLLRLPGESVGADAEVAYAKAHSIPVYHSIKEVLL